MHLLFVHVDGFKSYSKPTSIGPFHSQFNAITGLNGSGKSNILDAVCFVLGIKHLQYVRVDNLQSLIYKQGTAGVTKATVTLTFDNSDRAQSPIGYEDEKEIHVMRQISLGGRGKYAINGKTATETQISNLFRSVQLNVNNPHFLIMQGRITKVLNMKPEEIRGMLEEALGTLMYKQKRDDALKSIEQKDSKLGEINDTIVHSIKPKVEQLTKQKQEYQNYAAVLQELHNNERFLVAADYVELEKLASDSGAEKQSMQEGIVACDSKKKSWVSETSKARATLEQISRKRKEHEAGLRDAEKDKSDRENALIRKQAQVRAKEDDVTAEERKLGEFQKEIARNQKIAGDSDSREERARVECEEKKTLVREHREGVERARAQVEAAKAGASDVMQEQVLEGEKHLQELGTKEKANAIKRKALEAERKSVDKELASAVKTEKHNDDIPKRMEALRGEAETLCATQLSADTASSSSAPTASLEDQRATLTNECKTLGLRVQHFTQVKFNAKSAGLSENKVLGTLGNLIRLENTDKYARAVEVAVGLGKLQNIVVEDVSTAKALLQRGQLQTRTTIIPLDAVSARVADARAVQYAKDKAASGKAEVHLALDLLSRDHVPAALMPAMKFVLGQTLICDTIQLARDLAFDDKVKLRCVTLDGDVFDPAGTLTGGSRPAAGVSSPLKELADLRAAQTKLDAVVKELERVEAAEAKRAELASRLKQVEHEMKMLQAKLAESKVHRLETKLRELEAELGRIDGETKAIQEEMRTLQGKIKHWTDSIKNAAARKAALVKEAEDAEALARKKLKEGEDASKTAVQRYESVKSEKAGAQAECQNLGVAVDKSTQALGKMARELEVLREERAQSEQALSAAKQACEASALVLKKNAQQVLDAEQQISNAEREVQNLDLEKQSYAGKLELLQKKEKTARESLNAMCKQHPWIAEQKVFFGKANTGFDFELHDVDKSRARQRELKEKEEKMATTVNKHALVLAERAEQEYDELDKKRIIIEHDRAQIERVIRSLDKRQDEALKQMYEKVNEYFADIFATLLPGSTAKLTPVNNGEVKDGLEMRVAFGKTWKQSLTELSGGQRSLLAMSLVLALLRFKPAPMYILDEIDAALDLSHTQNIGILLRKHFAQSQFIVVSLKEGMFSNASVVFRTKFVDGVSTVARTENATNPSPLAVKDANAAGVEGGDGKSRKNSKTVGGKKRGHEEMEEEEEEVVGGGESGA